MKKLLGIALCFALLLGVLPGVAEEQNNILQGTITELSAEGLTMEDHQLGAVAVHIGEETQIETEEKPLEAGQYVFVEYDGAMTKSIPPQVTARAIRMFALSGEVQQVEEGKFLLMRHQTEEMIWVMVPEGTKVFAGDIVVAYYDGKMTKSSPAQISALHVVPTTVTGEVKSVSDESITLAGEDGSEYIVNLFEKTVKEVEPAVGDRVTVHYTGAVAMSMPPQISAIAVVEASEQGVEPLIFPAADQTEAAAVEEDEQPAVLPTEEEAAAPAENTEAAEQQVVEESQAGEEVAQ